MRKSLLASLFSLSLLGTACHDAKQGDSQASPQAAVPARVQEDAFALQVFRHLLTEQKGNVIFSPAGLEGVLKLLQQGARGKTAAELAALPMGRAAGPSGMQVAEATALFAAESLRLKPGVAADTVQRAPFETDAAKAAAIINAWADRKTRGMIPRLELDLGRDTRLVAASAIALDEKWLYAFPAASTHLAEFHLADGTVKQVQMMKSEADYRFARGEGWQAVALFYRADDRPGSPGCFIGILPAGDARRFAAGLTPEKLGSIRRALVTAQPQKMTVLLPRFETRTETFSLKPALQACSVYSLFTPAADFSGLADEPLVLADVQQRCYTKVNEAGTQAAAVTAAIVTKSMPWCIRFDRPFIWLIGDLATPAAPWFMGLFESPYGLGTKKESGTTRPAYAGRAMPLGLLPPHA